MELMPSVTLLAFERTRYTPTTALEGLVFTMLAITQIGRGRLPLKVLALHWVFSSFKIED
jgi:hypothetical protein